MSEEKQTSATSGKRAAMRAFLALAGFLGLAAAAFYADPDRLYLWVKAVHIIAVIAWMAGLFYLPRLFVYHTDAPPGSPQSETFKIMERRLINVIMKPAMVLTWLLGLYLAWRYYNFSGGWLIAKILLVVALSGVNGYFIKSAKRFWRDENTKSARYWRLMNEVPTLLMVAIIILVVVKPF